MITVSVPATRKNQIEWFRVISDLERSGMTQAQIGAAVGRSQNSINQYKSAGLEPRFHIGMLLLGLWFERTVVGTPIPMTARTEWKQTQMKRPKRMAAAI